MYVDRLAYPPHIGALASMERAILSTSGFIKEGDPAFRLIRIYRPGESGRSAADACPPRRSQSSMRMPS
jgi:hypothetical protein